MVLVVEAVQRILDLGSRMDLRFLKPKPVGFLRFPESIVQFELAGSRRFLVMKIIDTTNSIRNQQGNNNDCHGPDSSRIVEEGNKNRIPIHISFSMVMLVLAGVLGFEPRSPD